MKKEWFLKVLCVCGIICACLFLFTMHSSAQFSYNPYGYQQPYNPNNPYAYPWANQTPYGYQPPPPPLYYQGGSLANDMVGPYGYPGFSNPYAMYGDTRYFQ